MLVAFAIFSEFGSVDGSLMEGRRLEFVRNHSLWPRGPKQSPALTSSGLYTPSSYNGRPNLRPWRYAPPSYPAIANTTNGAYVLPSSAQAPQASAAEVFQASASQLTLLALKNEIIYAVTQYWVTGDHLSYLRPSGASGDLSLDEFDLARTTQLNSERGVSVTLRTRPRSD